ncbi:MAG: hypothetical protein ACYDHB_07220 [Candidatus Dormibacteria bacterium]
MSITTVKVDSTVRDRLSRIARARRTTMGALLTAVAEQLEAEQRWAEIELAYERVRREDPDGWAEYLGELAAWEASAGAGDAEAMAEWPEYNR